MHKNIQDWDGAIITYQLAVDSSFNYKSKKLQTSYDKMVDNLKNPNVRGVKILKVKMP